MCVYVCAYVCACVRAKVFRYPKKKKQKAIAKREPMWFSYLVSGTHPEDIGPG